MYGVYEGALFVSADISIMWMLPAPLLLLLLLALNSRSSPAYAVAALDIPPAPSPSIHASDQNSTGSNSTAHAFNRDFATRYQRLTILISTLFIAFLFLGFCAHYVRFRTCFHRRGSASRNIELNLAGLHPNGSQAGDDERGLEPWLVRSLPVVKYNAKTDEQDEEGGAAAAVAMAACRGDHGQVIKLQECAVCLCDYEEGEEIKELPVCGHRFHKACIDMWLFSHSTCPICRLSLRRHFKAALARSSANRPALSPSQSPASHPMPRASHVQLTMPSDSTSASTSSGPNATVVNFHNDVDADEPEDARNSSAALCPQFPSSA